MQTIPAKLQGVISAHIGISAARGVVTVTEFPTQDAQDDFRTMMAQAGQQENLQLPDLRHSFVLEYGVRMDWRALGSLTDGFVVISISPSIEPILYQRWVQNTSATIISGSTSDGSFVAVNCFDQEESFQAVERLFRPCLQPSDAHAGYTMRVVTD
ncbi:MAG TPA: hypothetical protein VNG90_01435 [Candidatus Acidoferrum sp.]|nr:hypothetical protein [Candidatus Acidoferrum sp.]